jgi:hypothetical protein
MRVLGSTLRWAPGDPGRSLKGGQCAMDLLAKRWGCALYFRALFLARVLEMVECGGRRRFAGFRFPRQPLPTRAGRFFIHRHFCRALTAIAI